jgi:hypothetical protein
MSNTIYRCGWISSTHFAHPGLKCPVTLYFDSYCSLCIRECGAPKDKTAVSFISTANRIANLVEKKNESYGDSITSSEALMKILYPNGISHEQYKDSLLVVRILDKLKRIATNNDSFNENPWDDIAGYGIRGSVEFEKSKQTNAPQQENK